MRIFISFLLSVISLNANEIESFISLLNSNADSLMKMKAIDSFMIVNNTFPIAIDTNCYFLFRGKADRIILTGDHTQWSQRGDTMKRFSGTDLHMVKKTFPADAIVTRYFSGLKANFHFDLGKQILSLRRVLH